MEPMSSASSGCALSLARAARLCSRAAVALAGRSHFVAQPGHLRGRLGQAGGRWDSGVRGGAAEGLAAVAGKQELWAGATCPAWPGWRAWNYSQVRGQFPRSVSATRGEGERRCCEGSGPVARSASPSPPLRGLVSSRRASLAAAPRTRRRASPRSLRARSALGGRRGHGRRRARDRCSANLHLQ